MPAVRSLLGRLADVRLTAAPSDGEALVYDAVAGKWVNGPAGSGGGGAPSGPAGGVLAGTYPDPGFAADMATQSELDTHTTATTGAHGGIVAATDPRLTDARTPVAHVHAGEDISTGTVADARIAATIARDSEVTAAIAALSTVYQPLDSDLTAVAALATTSFGRSLLALADAAAARVALGVPDPQWTVVSKSADEQVTSSVTVQNDDHLLFTATSGAVYEVDILLVYASPAGAGTPDLKVDFGEDGTTRGSGTAISLSSSDAPQVSSIQFNQTSTITVGTAASKRMLRCVGWYTGAGGTFRVRWAQATSDANPLLVYSGSLLRYRRIV